MVKMLNRQLNIAIVTICFIFWYVLYIYIFYTLLFFIALIGTKKFNSTNIPVFFRHVFTIFNEFVIDIILLS